jgi:hypothetical protein
VEDGIARAGVGDVEAGAAQEGGGRVDDLDLLAADLAVLARVRIDAAEADAWLGDAEVAHKSGADDAADLGDVHRREG